jgi:hypothetical protein
MLLVKSVASPLQVKLAPLNLCHFRAISSFLCHAITNDQKRTAWREHALQID